jgi:D-glycero-alpha-D-manno-heptose 1-phosphate guanylyltransferase
MKTRTAIVLAGGLGTRLRGVVSDVPKPMAPVNGRPFLAWLLEYWAGQGISHFILATGYKAEVIEDCFGPRFAGATLSYSRESTPIGTGGALLLAASRIDGDRSPFVVLNGDTYFPLDLEALDRVASARDASWCIGAFKASEAGRYGRLLTNADHSVVSMRSGAAELGELANGGVYRVSGRATLPSAPRDGDPPTSLEDTLIGDEIGSGGRVLAFESSAPFLDIGVPRDYLRASDFLMAHRDGATPNECP